MSNYLELYHFNMSKNDFISKKKSGHFNGFYKNLSFQEIPSTLEKFMPLFEKVGYAWGWQYKELYKNSKTLTARLDKPTSKLLYLLDDNKIIGYALITKPNMSVVSKVNSHYIEKGTVIEIENLGLFPGQEGGGRGGKLFEMIMDDLFKSYDHVYWSSRDYHAPTLISYYKNKIGMKHIGTDFVEDVRPQEIVEKTKQKTAA